jgi:hypothetical protein
MRRMQRKPSAVTVLTCLLVAFASTVVACGGHEDAKTSVARAATTSLGAGGAKIRFTATSRAATGTVTVTGTGKARVDPQRAAVNLEFRSPQSNGTIRELLQGPTVYMISPLLRPSIPSGKGWVKIDLEKTGRNLAFDFLSFSAATPNQTLRLLGHAVGAKQLGSLMIDGTKTKHYRARVDQSDVHTVGGAHVTLKPVDAWIDEHGTIRRARLDFSTGRGTRTIFTIDYTGYGSAVPVAPPDPSVVYDATSLSQATAPSVGK